jgi:hypothetical protein
MIPFSDDRFARGAMPDAVAFSLQLLRARRGKYRAADAAALPQSGIGGVNDGVHVHFGYVVAHNLKGHYILSCWYIGSIILPH